MAAVHRMITALAAAIATMALCGVSGAAPVYFDVPKGSHPHDVAAVPGGAGAPVFYTAQSSGKLGILDPKSGRVEEVALGSGSAPHGVVAMPYGPRPRGAFQTLTAPLAGSSRP